MGKPKTIQIITDISDQSWNEMYAVMRGIANSMSNEVVEIAPVTPVKELSIPHGAFLTRIMTKSYLSPVVIFTNVAPHQTFKSDLIAKIKDKDIIVMGSNNGIFDWVCRDFEFDYLAEIKSVKPFVVNGEIVYLPGDNIPKDYDDRFSEETAHHTFGAHVIYGAIAVGLALGVDYKKFAEDRSKSFVIPLDICNGEIVHIDNYGNLKICGNFELTEGSKYSISKEGKYLGEAQYITGRMMSNPTGTFVVYPSTSLPQMIDIALVRGNAAKELGVEIGDKLIFKMI